MLSGWGKWFDSFERHRKLGWSIEDEPGETQNSDLWTLIP